MDRFTEISNYIEMCMTPKLSSNFDELKDCNEYRSGHGTLEKNMNMLLTALKKEDTLGVFKKNKDLMPKLYILYQDLLCSGPWNSPISVKLAQTLSLEISDLFNISFDNIFRENNDLNNNDFFNDCMEIINKKLMKDHKKYPCLIAVYSLMVSEIKVYNIHVNVYKTMPVALQLIDEHNLGVKIKGLKCCKAVLLSMVPEDFQEGNYYEVISATLKKQISVIDFEVTQLVLYCFYLLIKLVPSYEKVSFVDDIFESTLNEVYTDTNCFRKTEFYNFLSMVIEVQKVHIAKRKEMFMSIAIYDLESCCTESAEPVFLKSVLETLTHWFKYGWCIWQFQSDHKLLSSLLKLLFISKEEIKVKIQTLILTLIRLSTNDQQRTILESLQKSSKISEAIKIS